MKYLLLAFTAIFSFSIASAQHKKTVPHKSAVSPAITAAINSGKLIYTQNCLSCHQADGYGAPNMNPPLIKTSYVLGDKKRIIGVVLNGLSHVDIDGNSYQNVMPPFNTLKDKEIADVLTYVRNSFGNKASAVTEPEVKVVRTSK